MRAIPGLYISFLGRCGAQVACSLPEGFSIALQPLHMPQSGSDDSRTHSHADAEVVVTVGPFEDHKDTRPPLWTVPVLVVAVRMLQSRNELSPSFLRSMLDSLPERPSLRAISNTVLASGQITRHGTAQTGGPAITLWSCHADSSSFVSCICLQGPCRRAAYHSGCLALAADGPPAHAWSHHTILAALRRCSVTRQCIVMFMYFIFPVVGMSQWMSRWSRMQLTARRRAVELKHRTHQSSLLMLLSGAALALHFCFWVEGIETTSITHALFFSSVTPIIIAGGMWALGHPISHGAQMAPSPSPGSSLHTSAEVLI